MIKVGIIGCGTIGKELALSCQKIFADQVTLEGITDVDAAHARKLQKELRIPASKMLTVDALINRCDLIIEAASK